MTSFTDSNKTYNVTPEHCTCPDFQYRQSKAGGKCRHQKMLIAVANRAMHFLLLKMKFDIRSQAVIEAKRANYYYYEMSLSA